MELMICSECGAVLTQEEATKFDKECGYWLECPHCGSGYLDEAVKCNGCGEVVRVEDAYICDGGAICHNCGEEYVTDDNIKKYLSDEQKYKWFMKDVLEFGWLTREDIIGMVYDKIKDEAKDWVTEDMGDFIYEIV